MAIVVVVCFVINEKESDGTQPDGRNWSEQQDTLRNDLLRLLEMREGVRPDTSTTEFMGQDSWHGTERLLQGSGARDEGEGLTVGPISDPVAAPTLSDVAAVVCSPEFPAWDCGWAQRTVWCESRNQADAVGHELYDSDRDGVPEDWYFVGWWQIASRVVDVTLFDPWENTRRAYRKFLSGGTGHWPYCGRE